MAAQLVRTRETSGSAKLKKGPDTQLENCQPYRHKNRWQAKTSTTNYHGGGSVATLGKEGLGGGSNSRALIMLHRVWYQSGSFSYSNVCVLCVCVCVCVCARSFSYFNVGVLSTACVSSFSFSFFPLGGSGLLPVGSFFCRTF
jgi:hypothetical protein